MEHYQAESTTFGREQTQSENRARFLTKTYNHLFGAIMLFMVLEIILFKTGAATAISKIFFNNMLLVFGGFVATGWFARSMAHKSNSKGSQYIALGAYVVIQAIIFVPLLTIANHSAPGAITSAALATIVGFGGLTLVAFTSRSNFSFLGAILKWGGVGALLLIITSLVFGFHLGTVFSVGMVFLAGAAILYDTSKIMYEFPEDRYVAASLELFASVALMFWYILRLFISSRN